MSDQSADGDFSVTVCGGDPGQVDPSSVEEFTPQTGPPGPSPVNLPYWLDFLNHPDQVRDAVKNTSQRLAKAVSRALADLLDPHCAALFNLDSSAANPEAFLSLMASGDNSSAYFTETFLPPDPDHPTLATNAFTQRTGWSMQNGDLANVGFGSNQYVVALNFLPTTPFNNGTVNDNAVTILHELGHVYEGLYGLGSTMLVNDIDNPAASAYNTALVQANCSGGH